MNIRNNKELLNILMLAGFCFIMFFAFLGSYPLIDVDETRYVRIAQEMLNSHNFLTPTINGDLFLEKPPLFFWLEDLSFLIFGISEWSARIPMAIVASFGVFMTYYFGKQFVGSRFGLLSAVTLGTAVIYIILSHIAILDLLLSVTMMVSAYFGIMTLFSQGRQNYTQWAVFYIFSALSMLSKGLPGVIIPFVVVFLAYLFSKRLKELFDFKKIGIGLILMLIVLLPWHIMMCKVHGDAFVNEYIIKHHIARFFNSAGINRKEPFWFYIPVIFVSIFPFSITLLTVLINEIRKIFVNFRTGFNFSIYKYFSFENVMEKKFLSLNILTFLTIFLFFSVSSTKLPTYILPAMFPLAFITGYIFDELIEHNKFDFQIKISNIIISIITYIAGLGGILILILNFANVNLNFVITDELKKVLLSAGILLLVYSFYNFVCIKKESSQINFFKSTVVFMMILTVITNLFVFNLIVSFGQKELINFSKYAKKSDIKLATFGFGHRYSAIYYYGNHVEIQENADYEWFNNKLNDGYWVILKNKNMMNMPQEYKFQVIETGQKYTLVKKADEEITDKKTSR